MKLSTALAAAAVATLPLTPPQPLLGTALALITIALRLLGR